MCWLKCVLHTCESRRLWIFCQPVHRACVKMTSRGGKHESSYEYGVFGTHWATRIFVPPSRQNRPIRHPTGKYQWASGRIFCTLSSPVHTTFTFMAKKTCRNRFFKYINPRTVHFLHCYFVCRKNIIDASSIIIRQLKTASARELILNK